MEGTDAVWANFLSDAFTLAHLLQHRHPDYLKKV